VVREAGHRLAVAVQVEIETKSLKQLSLRWFQAINSKRFRDGFHRFNLHRHTLHAAAFSSTTPENTLYCIPPLPPPPSQYGPADVALNDRQHFLSPCFVS
jgi:hypothetical protein